MWTGSFAETVALRRTKGQAAVLAATAKAMGIKEVRTAPRSPWQNAYVERFIGSVRREWSDQHDRPGPPEGCARSRSSTWRPTRTTNARLARQGLTQLTADQRAPDGPVIAIPQIGGLHHRYERRAA